MDHNWGRAIAGGVVGTIVMTAVGVVVTPMLGLPPSNPAKLLAGAMGGNMVMGWIAHFMIGAVLLPAGYVFIARTIPGSPVLRGALYGLIPWLIAMVAVMPMMGMPAFGGGSGPAITNLITHVIYGAVLGAIYGLPEKAPVHANA